MKEDKPVARSERHERAGAMAGRVVTHSAASTSGALAGAFAGAVGGTAAGPLGSIVGAVAGAVAGVAAGAVTGASAPPGEAFDTEPFVTWWRDHFADRPYVPEGARYADYEPVYRYAIEEYAASDHPRSWDEVAYELRCGWSGARGSSGLAWDDAMPAARDAWLRMYDPGAFA